MRRIFITALVSLASFAAFAGEGSCVASATDNPNPCKDMSANRIVAGSNKRVPPPKPVAAQPDPNASIPMGVVVDVHGHGKMHNQGKMHDQGKMPKKTLEAKP